MLPETVHLPNGENLTVTSVFGGRFFKANELNVHDSTFPPGWTIVIESQSYNGNHEASDVSTHESKMEGVPDRPEAYRALPFRRPTLRDDNLFISSISNPSSQDFKPSTSPTRQVAMMLWATLYWYFQQPEPSLYIFSEASKHTPDAGKPQGDWRINIKRAGVFSGRHTLQKLERMGLLYSEDSSVGLSTKEGPEGWSEMFASRQAFWMLSARLYLFTLTPMPGLSSESPYSSRPSSPVRSIESQMQQSTYSREGSDRLIKTAMSPGLWSGPTTPGPFASGSHLPTYYPPPPAQFIMSNGVRHPLRPKPPRQGEVFYSRYIPSVKQYLSFRVASLSEKPITYSGPKTNEINRENMRPSSTSLDDANPPTSRGKAGSPAAEGPATTEMSDLELLHKWMNSPRVSKFWGCSGPSSTQEDFLKTNLQSKHSFPAIGCWDGKPFGYFEIYWVKEDILGKHLNSGEIGDWDRGVHVLIGEEEFRGKHRLGPWITSLAHWSFLSDYRTNCVVLEPRVDNTRFIEHLQNCGFAREKEITFPHKQSAFVRLKRDTFNGPAL